MSKRIYIDIHFSDARTLYHVVVNLYDIAQQSQDRDAILRLLRKTYGATVTGFDYSPM